MCDLIPFRQMVNYGLTAVMPAHVIYPKVDSRPAGFSPVWLKNILRGQLGFEGCIFSDDLSMEGATVAGGIVQRAEAALNAGCDMVLVCNKPESADELLGGLHWEMPATSRATAGADARQAASRIDGPVARTAKIPQGAG